MSDTPSGGILPSRKKTSSSTAPASPATSTTPSTVPVIPTSHPKSESTNANVVATSTEEQHTSNKVEPASSSSSSSSTQNKVEIKPTTTHQNNHFTTPHNGTFNVPLRTSSTPIDKPLTFEVQAFVPHFKHGGPGGIFTPSSPSQKPQQAQQTQQQTKVQLPQGQVNQTPPIAPLSVKIPAQINVSQTTNSNPTMISQQPQTPPVLPQPPHTPVSPNRGLNPDAPAFKISAPTFSPRKSIVTPPTALIPSPAIAFIPPPSKTPPITVTATLPVLPEKVKEEVKEKPKQEQEQEEKKEEKEKEKETTKPVVVEAEKLKEAEKPKQVVMEAEKLKEEPKEEKEKSKETAAPPPPPPTTTTTKTEENPSGDGKKKKGKKKKEKTVTISQDKLESMKPKEQAAAATTKTTTTTNKTESVPTPIPLKSDVKEEKTAKHPPPPPPQQQQQTIATSPTSSILTSPTPESWEDKTTEQISKEVEKQISKKEDISLRPQQGALGTTPPPVPLATPTPTSPNTSSTTPLTSNLSPPPPCISPSTGLLYPVDQWSPEHSEGKKKYDRSFLMSCRNKVNPADEPTGLRNLLDFIRQSAAGQQQQNTYGGGGGGQRRSQQGGSGQDRSRRGVGKRQQTPRIPAEPLKVTDAGWKRPKASSQNDKIIQSIIITLNRLVASNFDELFLELSTLKIDSRELLEELIKQIFDKALKESKWASMYAKLCKKLSAELKLPEMMDEKYPVTFKRLLLNLCQKEFEENKWKANKKIPREKFNDIEIAELNLREENAHIRFIGNIMFIGELFKEGMLTTKIMHFCLQKLIGDVCQPSPEDMEALCKLLTSIGKILDTDKSSNYVQIYFERIEQIVKIPGIQPRIKFMLQNLQDLRREHWVTKNANTKAVTVTVKPIQQPIQQIQQPQILRPQAQRPSEWQEVSSSSTSSITITTTAQSSGRKPLSIKRSESKSPPPPGTVITPYQMQVQQGGGQIQNPKPIKPIATTTTTTTTTTDMLDGQQGLSKSQNGVPQSPQSPPPSKSPPPSTSPAPEVDEPVTKETIKKAENRVHATLEELLDSNDTDEALICLQSDVAPSLRSFILPAAVEFILLAAKDPIHAASVSAKLLHEAGMEDAISKHDFEVGLAEVAKRLPNLLDDAPPIAAAALGQLLGKLVFTVSVKLETALEFFAEVAESEKGRRNGGKLASEFGFAAAATAECLQLFIKERKSQGRGDEITKIRILLRDSAADIRSVFPFTLDRDENLRKFLIAANLLDISPSIRSNLLSEAKGIPAKLGPTQTAEWIESHLKQQDPTDPDLSIAIINGALAHLSKKHSKDDAELLKALQGEWKQVLVAALSGKAACIRAQVGAIYLMQNIWSSRNMSPGFFNDLLQFLLQSRLVPESVLEKWRFDKSERHIPNKEAATLDAAAIVGLERDDEDPPESSESPSH